MSATALATSLLIVGCATKATKDASAAEPRWQANGYLSPGRTDNPEIIGQFANKKDCDAAAKFWMQRQVVGNPIFAECLPIDTH
jgi:hypothetical protein